ncbi:MAG: Rieske (2Fe-2S) protein [Myxococcales bacterium]|nr:Rieske (2Fe-2S) protein [Myxococcales bacterium]
MKTTRRTALCVLGAAASVTTLGSVAGCDNDGNSQPQGAFDLGEVASLAVNGSRLNAEAAVILGRDAGGLYAYSTICTHEGCIVNAPDTSGVAVCPCHGARFDRNGAVLSGPTSTPLPHFQVTVANGRASVDTRVSVAASARAAV